MSLPTKGELYEQLTAHLRLGAEAAYKLSHLEGDNDKTRSGLWMALGMVMEKAYENVTAIYTTGRMKH